MRPDKLHHQIVAAVIAQVIMGTARLLRSDLTAICALCDQCVMRTAGLGGSWRYCLDGDRLSKIAILPRSDHFSRLSVRRCFTDGPDGSHTRCHPRRPSACHAMAVGPLRAVPAGVADQAFALSRRASLSACG